tara:strand:+ start:2675 stop:4030 length:1356 start_codon:yes stop_codon:yes gene_type:complete
MANPNSGHTAANITWGSDGLRDGDVITSATLTNIVHGVHGNGILRLQDNVFGMTSRNEVMTQSPGHLTRSDENTLTVKGGYCVLDGVLYSFAGGPGQSVNVDIDNTQNYCTSTVLAAGQECIYTVYLVGSSNSAHANARVKIAGGTPTTTTSGVFPPSASVMNVDPIAGYSELNAHSVILGVVRCVFQAGTGGPDNVNIIEINDKRVFIRPSPDYIMPLTSNVDATAADAATVSRTYRNGVNYDVQLKSVFGSGHVESGDFGGVHGSNRIDVAALWVSHQNWKASVADATDPAVPSSSDPNYGLGPGGGYDSTTATYADAQTPTDVLYFSGQGNAKQSLATGGAMTTVRLGSKGVDVFQLTVSGNKAWPVTSYGDQVFITDCTTAPSGSNFVTYTPTGEFPEGHMIWIQNTNGSHDNIRFNATGISNQVIESGKTAQYVYDGTTWYRLMYV